MKKAIMLIVLLAGWLSVAHSQIPAGILGQDSRDLSKEIWISFGSGFSQEGGVYVNAFNYNSFTTYSSYSLKNAKEDNTTFSFIYQENPDMGWASFLSTVSNEGLKIINNNTLNLRQDYDEEWGFISATVQLSNNGAVPVEVYVLGASNTGGRLQYNGWGKTLTTFAQPVYPIQTEMNVSEDWTKIEALVTNPISPFNLSGLGVNSNDIGKIRAIVIKLL